MCILSITQWTKKTLVLWNRRDILWLLFGSTRTHYRPHLIYWVVICLMKLLGLKPNNNSRLYGQLLLGLGPDVHLIFENRGNFKIVLLFARIATFGFFYPQVV